MGNEQFRTLHETSLKAVSSTSDPGPSIQRCSPQVAAERSRLLFGAYSKGEANDPDVFLMSVAVVLSEYPEDIVRYVTDPRTGLQRRLKWLPKLSEIAEACEVMMKPERERAIREAAAARTAQLAAPGASVRPRSERPTLAEIRVQMSDILGGRA